MANDRDRDQTSSQRGKQSDKQSDQQSGADEATTHEHTFGRGMTSPDSTEAVLRASDAEPDPRARGEGASQSGQSSRSSNDQDLEQDV